MNKSKNALSTVVLFECVGKRTANGLSIFLAMHSSTTTSATSCESDPIEKQTNKPSVPISICRVESAPITDRNRYPFGIEKDVCTVVDGRGGYGGTCAPPQLAARLRKCHGSGRGLRMYRGTMLAKVERLRWKWVGPN